MKKALHKSEPELVLDTVKPSELFAMGRPSGLSKEARMNVPTESYNFQECKEKQHRLINMWRDQSSIIQEAPYLPLSLIHELCDLGPSTLPL